MIKRVLIDLPEEWRLKIKSIAKARNITMQELWLEIIQRGLESLEHS